MLPEMAGGEPDAEVAELPRWLSDSPGGDAAASAAIIARFLEAPALEA